MYKMYKIWCCILLASCCLSGQTAPPSQQNIDKLKAALSALNTTNTSSALLSRQLADSMMGLAFTEHQPVRSVVESFSDEFADALAGKRVDNNREAVLQQCLMDILRGTGISNFSVAQHLRETLKSLRVDDLKAGVITRQLLTIGEAVRGPDDSPMRAKISK